MTSLPVKAFKGNGVAEKVFIFDIDGVLVEPGGYRESTRATVDYFAERMGFGDLYPGEDVIALFESHSITSEWDSIPIILAAAIDRVLEAHPGVDLPGTFAEAVQAVRRLNPVRPDVDYERLISRIAAAPPSTYIMAHRVLALCGPDVQEPLLPRLSGHPLLDDLLGNTREVLGCPVTRIFQQFVLGSAAFERKYGVRGDLQTPSLIARWDRPLLDPDLREEMLALWRRGDLHLTAYTARPCGLDGVATPPLLPYSPEAEMALANVGLQDIPLMGYGFVYYLAEQAGRTPDAFVKPSPVQALGAIGAALRREPIPAIASAERLFSRGEADFFRDFPPLEVHVFEDSAGSIRGTREAARCLTEHGVPAEVHAWGVARNPVKVRALEAAGVQVFASVNEAIRLAMAV